MKRIHCSIKKENPVDCGNNQQGDVYRCDICVCTKYNVTSSLQLSIKKGGRYDTWY